MPHFDDRENRQQASDDGDLLELNALFVPLNSRPAPVVEQDDDDDTERVPQITRMPEGISVVEHQIGHAIGQWVFVLLCDCGRRWFTLHAVDNAQCPRCERWVRVEADPNKPG
jgi:hypothetical protein